MLLALDLHDEHVVDVVVVVEAPVLWWRHVGVHLHRVAQVGGEVLRGGDDRRPGAVQPLEHDARASGEQTQHAVLADLVPDGRAHAATEGVGRGVEGGALLRHPQERGAQRPLSEEGIDRGRTEAVFRGRKLRCTTQHGSATPVLLGEDLPVEGNHGAEPATPAMSGGRGLGRPRA